jgi:hypothetical protein
LRAWYEAWFDVADGTTSALLLPEKPSIEVAENTSERPKPTQDSPIKAGERVFASSCPHTDKFGPFLVEFVDGALAKLEMFYALLPVRDLRIAT